MRFSPCLGVLALVSHAAAYAPESTEESDALAAHALDNLQAALADGSLKAELATKNVTQECTVENAAVRKE